MRKFDKVSAGLSFSPKYFRAVAENAIKSLVFMYHEAMSIFLGSKNFLNLVYLWVFQKHTVSAHPTYTNRSPPWHGWYLIPLNPHFDRVKCKPNKLLQFALDSINDLKLKNSLI